MATLEQKPATEHAADYNDEKLSSKPDAVEHERHQLLANLPDPDEGKSEEERRKIDRKLMWKVDLWLIPWLSLLYLLRSVRLLFRTASH
jgi:hypothetical protein